MKKKAKRFNRPSKQKARRLFLLTIMFIAMVIAVNVHSYQKAVPATIPVNTVVVEEVEEPDVCQGKEAYEREICELALEYNQDEVLAREIMRCEGQIYGTKNNQNKDSNGVVWSTDIGPWQINDYYHKQTMSNMGLNIYDRSDNLRYGFYLLSIEGTTPWNASRHCWS